MINNMLVFYFSTLYIFLINMQPFYETGLNKTIPY